MDIGFWYLALSKILGHWIVNFFWIKKNFVSLSSTWGGVKGLRAVAFSFQGVGLKVFLSIPQKDLVNFFPYQGSAAWSITNYFVWWTKGGKKLVLFHWGKLCIIGKGAGVNVPLTWILFWRMPWIRGIDVKLGSSSDHQNLSSTHEDAHYLLQMRE